MWLLRRSSICGASGDRPAPRLILVLIMLIGLDLKLEVMYSSWIGPASRLLQDH